MLLVVDDAWKSEEATAFRVDGLNCAHLLTTRKPSIADDFAGNAMTTIQELSDEDGLLLLKSLAPKAVAIEPDAAAKLVEAVGNLPLALILMGRYLRKEAYTNQPRRISQALQQLQETEVRLTHEEEKLPGHHPGLPDEMPLSLVAAIAISVENENLNESTRCTLYALSLFPPKPNTFSEEAAVAVSAEPVKTLDSLTDYGLLEASGPGRYTLHQTIADYAKWKHADDKSYERLASYFVKYIKGHAQEFDILEQELTNVLAALDAAHKHEMHIVYVQAVEAFYHFLNVRGLYRVAEPLLQKAKHIAKLANNKTSLITLSFGLGQVASNLGSYEEAENSTFR